MVEISDAEVVPAHPIRVVARICDARQILAEIEAACAFAEFNNWIGRMIFAEHVVQVALAQVTVVHARAEREWAFRVGGDAETVANHGGAARLNGVVVGDGMDVPHFVVICEFALRVDGAIGEAVGAFVNGAVGVEEAAVINRFAGCVLHFELDPGFDRDLALRERVSGQCSCSE